MFNKETATTEQLIAYRVQDITKALVIMKRIISFRRDRFFKETDGRVLRRLRREYATSIESYLYCYRVRQQLMT